MRKMHERHVRLMREMDENYRLMEQETQEYYVEFFNKWKEEARSKIMQYRRVIESLVIQKEEVEREKSEAVEALE